MAKVRTKKIGKEPIKLRAKTLKDGTQSLYLDYFIDGKRSYEFLKLYLVPGTGPLIKSQNDAVLSAANAIKNKRLLEYTNNRAGFVNTSGLARQKLRDWMETFRLAQEKKGAKDQKLIRNTIHALTKFNIDIKLRDINRKYCIDLTNFLRNDYRTVLGAHLMPNTAINYLGCLRNALNMAVREGVLAVNPLNQLSAQDKIKKPESKREFLTIEEVQQLEETPCKFDFAKRAFLFGCYCGLRISDIRRLKWSDLIKDGDNYRINIVMYKTQSPIYIPLSKKAIDWIPERKDMSEDALLFPGLPEQISAPLYLNDWFKTAGITKNITFHGSRHTYATMLLTLGVDIYTVSKLLGHTKIETTQIYAQIINKKKDDAVSLIDNIFNNLRK
jgi:integrase